MSDHPTDFRGDVLAAIREAIASKIPGAQVTVTGGGGHYTIGVSSPAFSGKSMLASHRLVYSAIAHLMQGEAPPVHAVDSLTTQE
ncbi:MAG: BolA family transcriptional regulator [Polyangiaceae bacterium]|nr:BolA family transcriptional regulator [Polyangiaceae bacterium]